MVMLCGPNSATRISRLVSQAIMPITTSSASTKPRPADLRTISSSAAPIRASAMGSTMTQSATRVTVSIMAVGRFSAAISVTQWRVGRVLGLSNAHGVGIVGVKSLIGAIGQNQQETEHGEANDNGGQDQRLRQWIGNRSGGSIQPPWDNRRNFPGQTTGGEDQQIDAIAQHHDTQQHADQRARQQHVDAQRDEASNQSGNYIIHQRFSPSSLSRARTTEAKVPNTTR